MQRHQVLQKACDYLARREHSQQELQRKLASVCGDTALVEELLQKLAEQGLQSDARFVQGFVQQRSAKGQGPVKIRQELRQRGLAEELIDDCLSDSHIDWYPICQQVRQKRFGKQLPCELKDKAKQSRFLYARGFDSEMIQHALDKVDE